MTEKRVPDDDYLWDGSGEPDAEIVRLEARVEFLDHRDIGTERMLVAAALQRSSQHFGQELQLFHQRFRPAPCRV